MSNSIAFSETTTLNCIVDEDGNPVPEIPRSTEADYFYYEETVVDKMPAKKPPRDPESMLGKLKAIFKPPAVKAVEHLPKREGKFYHVDEQGRVIQTTVRRAYVNPGIGAFSGGF